MKALRYTMQLVVFLFFAGYFLALVTGHDIRFPQILTSVAGSPEHPVHSVGKLKPSPIERLAELSR